MWFWYSLLAAVISAISIITLKKVLSKVNAALVTWSLFALSIPPLLLIVLKKGIPEVNNLFFIGIIASSVLFTFSKTISLSSLGKGLLSKIYPLTSFGTIFTYLFGLAILSESIRFLPLMGMFLIIAGAYILNVDAAHEGIFKPIKILFTNKIALIYVLSMAISSLAGIFDKIALKNTSFASPEFIVLTENIISTILLTSYLTKQDKNWVNELKNNFVPLFIASMIYMVLVIVIFLAFLDGPIALVNGVKRLEVFFVLLLSFLFFQDKPTKHSVAATIIMVIGVIFTKL